MVCGLRGKQLRKKFFVEMTEASWEQNVAEKPALEYAFRLQGLLEVFVSQELPHDAALFGGEGDRCEFSHRYREAKEEIL
jgi:hypothetical protein